MIHSLSSVHFCAAQNPPQAAAQEEKALPIAQEAIKNTRPEPKKGLCDRFLEALKHIRSRIREFFCRLFPACMGPERQAIRESLAKLESGVSSLHKQQSDNLNRLNKLSEEVSQRNKNPVVEPSTNKTFTTSDAPEFMNAFFALEETQAKEREKLDSAQMNQWYEELKNKINLVPSEHMNFECYHPDDDTDTHNRNNLLINAIMYIHDSQKRLEIVQLLLDKGVDPNFISLRTKIIGTHEFAEEKHHQPLIDLIRERGNPPVIRNEEDERNLQKKREEQIEKDAALDDEVSFDAYLQAFVLLCNGKQRFSDQDVHEKVKALNLLIPKIKSSNINQCQEIETEDKNVVLKYNLLHMAIMNITDNDKCLEIAQLLLNQGTNPSYAASSNTYISLLQVARETNDQGLIDLIESKLQKVA